MILILRRWDMNINSLVECVHDFTMLKKIWKIEYPEKGDILTVSNISRHPRDSSLIMLSFHEKPDIPPLCLNPIDKKHNFIEIQEPLQIKLEELDAEIY